VRRFLFASTGIPLAVLPPVQVRTLGTWHGYWIRNIATGDVDMLLSEYRPPTMPAGWRMMTDAERRAHLWALSPNGG
jgi:hypothetical protein